MLNAITDQALEVGSRLSKFYFWAKKNFSKKFSKQICADFADTRTVQVGCRDFEGTTTASLKT